jgi:glucan phosphorylase
MFDHNTLTMGSRAFHRLQSARAHLPATANACADLRRRRPPVQIVFAGKAHPGR